MTTIDVAKLLDSMDKLASAYEDISLMLLRKSHEPAVFNQIGYKGKEITDELTQPIPRKNTYDQRGYALFDCLSGADEDEDEDTVIPGAIEDAIEDEDPVTPSTIPCHIEALDLATPDNPFQFPRTHATPRGALKKKQNASRMSTEHRKNGAPGFTKKTKLPRCTFGTRRMLDYWKDDLDERVCWFHQQNVNKLGNRCLR